MLFLLSVPGVEEKCSLADPVDILAYSEREWKGNTAKSNLIRKVSDRCKGMADVLLLQCSYRNIKGRNTVINLVLA